MEATEREGAALREELARCRETRQALLERWHQARIQYDEVRKGETCGKRARSSSFVPSPPSVPPLLTTHTRACACVHVFMHTPQVQLQLLEAQGRVDAASKGIKDAQRLHARLRPSSSAAAAASAASAAGEGGQGQQQQHHHQQAPATCSALEEEVRNQ